MLIGPLLRQKEQFCIVHNSTEYLIDPFKMAESSELFRNEFFQKDFHKYELNDMHSEPAFSSFIKLCMNEHFEINLNDKIEIFSLFDEWKCTKIKNQFENKIYNQVTHEEMSEPFVELPVDFDSQNKKKINVLNIKEAEKINAKDLKITLPLKNEGKNGLIKIFIKTEDGSIHTVVISKSIAVLTLKKMSSPNTRVPVNSQELFFNQKNLKNEKSLLDYGIENNSIIYLKKKK